MFHITNVTGVEDGKARIMTSPQQSVEALLVCLWEELEFRLDVLRATQSAHAELA
jgi:hypothetical protein